MVIATMLFDDAKGPEAAEMLAIVASMYFAPHPQSATVPARL
jgi:hypothetical protein